MNHTPLSEEDFKVEAHACAISLPAVRTATQHIDFDSQQLNDYFIKHYQRATTNTTEYSQASNTSNNP